MGKSIKIQRKESILKEILPEALAQMNDNRINSLSVVDVVCSRDGSDAKVYLGKSYLNDKEQRDALKQLKLAHGNIQSYTLKTTGWYKVPNFAFTFDELFEKENKMEKLFEKIKKGSDGSL